MVLWNVNFSSQSLRWDALFYTFVILFNADLIEDSWVFRSAFHLLWCNILFWLKYMKKFQLHRYCGWKEGTCIPLKVSWKAARKSLTTLGELLNFFLNWFLLEYSCLTLLLVSTVQQSESAIHIHTSASFWTFFVFRSPQSIRDSSLCYTLCSL